MRFVFLLFAVIFLSAPRNTAAQQAPSTDQLARWLKRFPDADANKDGTLSQEEALAYRKKLQKNRTGKGREGRQPGAPREFEVDPGWKSGEFPAHAVSLKSPEEIKAIYAEQVGAQKAVVSFPEQESSARRIIGTGHSFMAPGYGTMPRICRAAGFEQPLYTHIGGGITGSTRYKWEQENGIYQFDRKPTPKLLASIANAEWDVMMWGPYFNDRPEYYTCWIEFCRKFHPDMKFYLSDAWPQLYQLGDETPESETFFTEEIFQKMGDERSGGYAKLVSEIREKTTEHVYILPTSNAMTLAAQAYLRGELPGIEGINRVIGGKERSLWRDHLGHLGPGFERLEGYVFYATIYGKSPELISEPIEWRESPGFPSGELDEVFRRIAWEAVISHPLSGVKDADGDGTGDVAAE